MTPVRAALYLDFDNVFSGLLKLDPDVAQRFAEDPAEWLRRLSEELTIDGERRWLVLRCYLNPEGSAPNPTRPGERLHFSRFRRHFTRAGFEIVDCPRLGATKNAADIRLVMDALDALRSPAAYDEFVIASGDSDLTPLLVRLRAEGRRTTVLTASEAAEAFTAVADVFVSGDQLLRLVADEQPEDEDDDTPPSPPVAEAAPEAGDGAAVAAATVRSRYAAATEPLNLASLAQQVRQQVLAGPGGDLSTWFGKGTFRQFVESLGLPHLAIAQNHLWNQWRHVPPEDEAVGAPVPAAVVRLTSLLKFPTLERSRWPAIYGALEEYARTQPFSLSESTKWVRDQLAQGELGVGRTVVGVVVKGTAFGGCPLYRDPPPRAEEISEAFVANALARAESAGVVFDHAEVAEIRDWFGVAG